MQSCREGEHQETELSRTKAPGSLQVLGNDSSDSAAKPALPIVLQRMSIEDDSKSKRLYLQT